MSEDAGLDIDFDAPPGELDRQLAGIQATTAGVTPDVEQEVVPGTVTTIRSVEFLGRRFRIADKIGLMPLLKFAAFADVNVQDPRALGAMYTLLRDCIHPGCPGCGKCEFCKAGNEPACKVYDRGDWGEFEEHAMITKADADDLMDVITKTIELIAGRPTPPPGTSSGGRRATSRGSTGTSSGRQGKASRR
jgi:hypothetical protein